MNTYFFRLQHSKKTNEFATFIVNADTALLALEGVYEKYPDYLVVVMNIV